MFPPFFMFIGFSNQSCLKPLGESEGILQCSVSPTPQHKYGGLPLSVPLVCIYWALIWSFMERSSLFLILIFRKPEMFLQEELCALHCFPFKPSLTQSPAVLLNTAFLAKKIRIIQNLIHHQLRRGQHIIQCLSGVEPGVIQHSLDGKSFFWFNLQEPVGKSQQGCCAQLFQEGQEVPGSGSNQLQLLTFYQLLQAQASHMQGRGGVPVPNLCCVGTVFLGHPFYTRQREIKMVGKGLIQ